MAPKGQAGASDGAQQLSVSGGSAAPGSSTQPFPAMIVQALSAIGAGIGVLGFVILCGGALTYVRLQATGLPAVEGTARVPRAVLLTTGAAVLVPAALTTLGVVAVLFCVDLFIKARESGHLAELEERLTRSQEELDALLREQHKREQEAKDAQVAVGAATQKAAATPQAAGAEARGAAQRQLEAAQQTATNLDLAQELVAAADERLQRQRAELARRRALELHARRRGTTKRVLFGSLALLGLELILLLFVLDTPALRQFPLVVAAAFATALMAFSIFASTQQFAWFGVAAFLSIGTVFGMARFYETQNDPQVAPVAVLRSDRAPTAGFLVADTGGVLLVGAGGSGMPGGEMLVMPRSEVRDLVVGEQTDPGDARVAALVLLKRLCGEYTADDTVVSTDPAASTRSARHRLCTPLERRQVLTAWTVASRALHRRA